MLTVVIIFLENSSSMPYLEESIEKKIPSIKKNLNGIYSSIIKPIHKSGHFQNQSRFQELQPRT
jgi:hypothetical protein